MAIGIKKVVEYAGISVIVFFLFVGFLTQLFPYFDNVEHARTRIRKADLYLATDICTNPAIRSELEDYNECERSKLVSGQNPWLIGLYDTASNAHLCANNECVFLGFNLTTILGRLIILGCAMIFLTWMCCSAYGVRAHSEWDERRHFLPDTMYDMSTKKRA